MQSEVEIRTRYMCTNFIIFRMDQKRLRYVVPPKKQYLHVRAPNIYPQLRPWSENFVDVT